MGWAAGVLAGLFDVEVDLSPYYFLALPKGLMQVNCDRADGGSYGCIFDFFPLFSFFSSLRGVTSPLEFGAEIVRKDDGDCCVVERVIARASGREGLLHDVCVPECTLCTGGACCTGVGSRGLSIARPAGGSDLR